MTVTTRKRVPIPDYAAKSPLHPCDGKDTKSILVGGLDRYERQIAYFERANGWKFHTALIILNLGYFVLLVRWWLRLRAGDRPNETLMANQPPLPPPPDPEAILTTLQHAVATNSADMLARTQEKILPETWELNRWMLASLLAMNSAAAAAVYSTTSISAGSKITACWFFIGGALAALLSGFLLTFVLGRMEKPVTDAQAYWAAVAGGAARSEQVEGEHASAITDANSTLPQWCLYASALSFIIGIVTLPRG